MTTTNNCMLCVFTVAVAVASGFHEVTSTEEPRIRIVRSPQSSITDGILGSNIQFIGQAARSGQSVLESKLNAARAMVESGSDMIVAKVQAARDMAGAALNGGKTIAGTTLGTISETADGLVIALGYPSEASSRRRRDSDKGGKQRDAEYDDKDADDYDDDDDDDPEGMDADEDDDDRPEKEGGKNDDNSKKDKKYDDEDDKSKKRGKEDDRRKRDSTKEDMGARRKRSLSQNVDGRDLDGFKTAALMLSPCIDCMPEVMSKTVALKGGAVGGIVGMLGSKKGAAGVGSGSVGVGLVGGTSGGSGGKAGVGPGLIGVGIGGAIAGEAAVVVGRKKREARRFGGGRSRFSPARGGAPKKGQSDTSGGSESSGGSSAQLRQKRSIIEHVLQHLRRDKRQDTTPATGNKGKTNCFSFHSMEESEEDKKFWESFHNMMNAHDKDWNFDFESEMCTCRGGSTGEMSTNGVEGAREATTPLPPTIDA